MATAANAELQYESSVTPVAMSALTDSGDHKTFTGSAEFWSRKAGYGYTVRPNGLRTGGAVTPGAANDTVDVAALTAYIGGVEVSVAAAAATAVTRGTAGDTHKISSITATAAGAIAVVAGTASTAFSETRAAAGGPPLIPVTSIEIAQVRLTATSAAVVTASEIKTQVGTHQERYDYPPYQVNVAYADGTNAGVVFDAALPASHTGPTAKAVYASYSDPSYVAVELASDFVPPVESSSVSSTQVYRNRTVGAESKTLGAGSFTCYLADGVTDALLAAAGDILSFKFFPDRTKAPYWWCQGRVSATPSYPAGDNMTAAVTIAAESAAIRRES